MSLEIYAEVEDLLGIEEATHNLHQVYLDELEERGVKSVLDLGCGRGLLMQELLHKGIECDGIDLSETMVHDAKESGLNVEHKSICEVNKSYDAIVAVFDVLNFIKPEELETFFVCVAEHLHSGGVFIADVNSLYGFREVAEGVMSVDAKERFLNIEAIFNDDELHTTFTLFKQVEGDTFKKQQSTIVQYFHNMKVLKKQKSLKMIKNYGVSLYDEDDKTLLIFKKAQ